MFLIHKFTTLGIAAIEARRYSNKLAKTSNSAKMLPLLLSSLARLCVWYPLREPCVIGSRRCPKSRKRSKSVLYMGVTVNLLWSEEGPPANTHFVHLYHDRSKRANPASLIFELPSAPALHRLQPHTVNLDLLGLIRLSPILFLLLRARHSRSPESWRRSCTRKSLTMPTMLVRERLRASLHDDIFVLRNGVMNREICRGEPEHFFEQLGV